MEASRTVASARIAAAVLTVIASGAPRAQAPPPTFGAEDEAAFFDDAFAALVGPRPEQRAGEAAGVAGPTAPGAAAAESRESIDWSAWVHPDTLETETKRLAQRLASAVQGRRVREANDARGMLAITMAVIARHPDNPRWRDIASAASAALAEGDPNEASSEDDALASARGLAAAMGELVRGGRPEEFAGDATVAVDWGHLAGRAGLMRRLEEAEPRRLDGWLADARSFRRAADDVRHEAEVAAMVSEALVQPGAADAGDGGYAEYARRLRDAASGLAAAAESGDFDAARRTRAEASRACAECHADYRG